MSCFRAYQRLYRASLCFWILGLLSMKISKFNRGIFFKHLEKISKNSIAWYFLTNPDTLERLYFFFNSSCDGYVLCLSNYFSLHRHYLKMNDASFLIVRKAEKNTLIETGNKIEFVFVRISHFELSKRT